MLLIPHRDDIIYQCVYQTYRIYFITEDGHYIFLNTHAYVVSMVTILIYSPCEGLVCAYCIVCLWNRLSQSGSFIVIILICLSCQLLTKNQTNCQRTKIDHELFILVIILQSQLNNNNIYKYARVQSLVTRGSAMWKPRLLWVRGNLTSHRKDPTGHWSLHVVAFISVLPQLMSLDPWIWLGIPCGPGKLMKPWDLTRWCHM